MCSNCDYSRHAGNCHADSDYVGSHHACGHRVCAVFHRFSALMLVMFVCVVILPAHIVLVFVCVCHASHHGGGEQGACTPGAGGHNADGPGDHYSGIRGAAGDGVAVGFWA